MAYFSIFKAPEYRKFNFKTRYYNADKEELMQRVEQAKREVGASNAINNEGEYVQNIKGRMKNYIDKPIRPIRKRAERISNMRLFVIIVILSAIAYYLLY